MTATPTSAVASSMSATELEQASKSTPSDMSIYNKSNIQEHVVADESIGLREKHINTSD